MSTTASRPDGEAAWGPAPEQVTQAADEERHNLIRHEIARHRENLAIEDRRFGAALAHIDSVRALRLTALAKPGTAGTPQQG